MQYLVDTDWVIDHLHGRERVVRQLEELEPEGIGLSVVSLAELYEGVFYSTTPQDNEKALQDFLHGIEVLTLNDDICRIFAQERGRLRTAGLLIGDFDLLLLRYAMASRCSPIIADTLNAWMDCPSFLFRQGVKDGGFNPRNPQIRENPRSRQGGRGRRLDSAGGAKDIAAVGQWAGLASYLLPLTRG